jgi:hypothetical protein
MFLVEPGGPRKIGTENRTGTEIFLLFETGTGTVGTVQLFSDN